MREALLLCLLLVVGLPVVVAERLSAGIPLPASNPVVLPPGVSVPAPLVAAGDWRALAQSKLGLLYVWGGSGGRNDLTVSAVAFDCSGASSWLERLGFGRTVLPQTQLAFDTTVPIDRSQVRDGDLVFWNMWSRDPRLQHMAVVYDASAGLVWQAGGLRSSVNIAGWDSNGPPTFRRPL